MRATMRAMFKETKQKVCTGSKRTREDRDAKDRQNANQTKTNNEHILSFTEGLRQKTQPHITARDKQDR